MTRKEMLKWAEDHVNRVFHHEKKEGTTIEGWVARDIAGGIYCHKDKPRKKRSGIWSGGWQQFGLPASQFPSVKWKDKEPRKVRITIEEI